MKVEFDHWKTILIAMVATVLAAACATPEPRQVQAIDSSENSVKFLYSQPQEDGQWDRGIIECDIDEGELSDCRHLDVEYR